MEKKAFREFVDLDTCTLVCPCGASVTYPGGDDNFRETHLEHTNATIESHITDDGMRCLPADFPRNSVVTIKTGDSEQ